MRGALCTGGSCQCEPAQNHTGSCSSAQDKMVVDSHVHMNFLGQSVHDVVRLMDQRGVEKCWALTWEEVEPVSSSYQHLSVEDLFSAYEQYPERIVPFYAPDPRRPDAVERLRAWYTRGVRGCGELKVSLRWESTEIGQLLHCVRELPVPLVFHMEDKRMSYACSTALERIVARLLRTSHSSGLPAKLLGAIGASCGPLDRMRLRMTRSVPGYLLDFASLELRLREFPGVDFIGHGPLFWKAISGDLASASRYPNGPVKEGGITCRLLEQYDNLFADLSGVSGYNALKRDRGFAGSFVRRFEHKLLFGTDNCELGLEEFLVGLGLPARTLSRVMGENARDLLGHRR